MGFESNLLICGEITVAGVTAEILEPINKVRTLTSDNTSFLDINTAL